MTPKVTDILTFGLKDLQSNLAGYLLTGLVMMAGITALALPPAFLFAGGFFWWISSQDPGRMDMGMFALFNVACIGLMAWIMLLQRAFQAVVARALLENPDGSISAGMFSGRIMGGLADAVGPALVLMPLVVVGFMACFLPGLVLLVVFELALVASVHRQQGIFDAMGWCWGEFRRDPTWHVAFGGAQLLLLMAINSIPFLGVMAFPLRVRLQVATYRILVGETDALPVLKGVG